MIMKRTAQFSGSIHVYLRANVNENREMNKGEKLQGLKERNILLRQCKNTEEH
jgi:hypothetical protein